MGVQISIDDFGTEYSSIPYLRRFPLTRRDDAHFGPLDRGEREGLGLSTRWVYVNAGLS